MNKVLIASLAMATALFAQTQPADAAQAAGTPADTAKVAVADTSSAAKAAPAETQAQTVPADTAKVAADSTASAPADSAVAAAPAADSAAVAPADTAKVAEAPADTANVAAVEAPAADTAKAAPADTAKVAEESKPTAADSAIAATAKPIKLAPTAANDNSMAAAGSEPAKKKKQEPLFKAGEFVFNVDASFEVQAGKTLWTSEDDKGGDNLEEWWGRANLGLETHSNDFNGRIHIYMYPGDLMDNQYHARHTASKDTSESYDYKDLFEIHEAWAEQHTKYLAFKVGRWEFTQKNGDYFGNYVDGYYNGFKSGTESENALQFTLTPTETMTMDVSLISTTPNLNTGDLRLMFHFHDLSGIEFLNLDLGYRTNVFDLVHDDDANVRHTIALQGKTPVVDGLVYFFLEGALMGINAEETYTDKSGKERTRTVDMVAPITGGLLFTPRDYRIILEAEYIHDRADTEYAEANKHIKDVLAAFYIEKPLSDRFTLSFGAHSYGSSRDVAFTGNLIGVIN